MIMKIVIVLLLLFILFALGRGLYFLVHQGEKRDRHMVKALSWRIGLSLALFFLLIIAFFKGWIVPHPFPLGQK